MRARAAALVAVGLAVAGCGGGAAPSAGPPPDPHGSGWFAGSGADGVGATVDLLADDPVTAALDAALPAHVGAPGERPVVGIAAIVNDGRAPVPPPSFVAVFSNGGAAPLADPRRLLAAADGPAARRALRLLRGAPASIPPGRAATAYVVLRRGDPADVASVRMVVRPGEPVTLRARRR